ncbi:DUF4142 domain-containing protein [Pyxidicoccus parkwayensis]|uniref:DUF4142 domain-containing protein n=1 Tax=Pyxidicoccus parkwayensis TaxID=2813578 RepID=A0ABX7NPE3_9BACT|nr:DUF4142 domain-containing protein [Pyxidicoccus parkwaysis]QSQ20727.1 DUF4142 domain-containing protein [Pyxidicoccus parkwaysis]
MAGVRSSVGVAGLSAALLVGLLVGCVAHAEDAEKRERQIGEAAADREEYVGQLVVFDAKQISLAKLALEHSQDPQVRQYAKKLLEDHQKHLKDLETWAQSKRVEVAAVDLSTTNAQGTGGSGSAGVQKGYDERKVGVDKRLDKAIEDAKKDVGELQGKEGKDFDKAFLSRVVDDQKDGQELVGDGLDTYRADATFGLLLNHTNNLIDQNLERGKQLEKVVD